MKLELVLFIWAAAVVSGVGVILLLMYHRLSLAISRISQKLPENMGNVIAQIEALGALQTELKLTHALPPTRGWAGSPDFLRNLMVHVLDARPHNIVECSSGISTVILARCVELLGEGHVYSLEHDEKFAEKTRVLLRQHGLNDFATVLNCPLKQFELPNWSGNWYSHDVLPEGLTIDLLVIDGPPWFTAKFARYPALPLLHGRLNPNAVVILDDSARDEEVIAVQRWLAEFADLSLLEMPVCEKGCVALKKGST